MKKENRAFREMRPLLERFCGAAQTQAVMTAAQREYDSLCKTHASDPKAVKKLTLTDIYPCISLYRGLLEVGTEQGKAVAFLDESWSLRAEKKAASMRMLMKLPGLYRLYPAMFRSVAQKQFGTEAGFAATYYPTEKTRVKFDMTRCLYCEVCRQEGCFELVPCFCHTDDVNNGNLHPRLCWNRTKILGDGADCCDFDLFVTEKK